MNFKDLPEKPCYDVPEYRLIEKLIPEDLEKQRKHKAASRARLELVNAAPYGSDYYSEGISAYVASQYILGQKKTVFCKKRLMFGKLHKNYEEFIKIVAKAEDDLYEHEQKELKSKNTAHQLLRKIVSKYGFKIWDSVYHQRDASASGKILGNEVAVHYDQKANNFSLEIHHLEIDEIEQVLAALKGLEKK